MTERTALILAGYSHSPLPLLLIPVMVVLGILAHRAGVAVFRAGEIADSGLYRRAVTARIAHIALCLAAFSAFAVGFLHVGCAALKAHSSQCSTNVRQLGLAVSMYVSDNDERYPAASRWSECAALYLEQVRARAIAPEGDPFVCPATETPASYALNAQIGGISEAQIGMPASLVMLFDALAPSRSYAGGIQDLALERHSHCPNVCLGDGHVKGASQYNRAGLLWVPHAPESAPSPANARKRPEDKGKRRDQAKPAG